VEIGDDTTLREYVTINRATAHSWVTRVGKGCFLMSYVHIAHDCALGDGVIISNGTQLAGHVVVEDRATISGLVAAHQFVRIGAHAFVGGASRVHRTCRRM
jgi:UDP-N-acetylglucosamine acyltransferase